MSNYGIKISRPGYNVETADDKDLVFSSAFNTFKIYRTMKFAEAGSAQHGLTYPPTFLFLTPFDGYKWRQGNGHYYNNWNSMVEVDDTHVYSEGKAYVILFIDPLDE